MDKKTSFVAFVTMVFFWIFSSFSAFSESENSIFPLYPGNYWRYVVFQEEEGREMVWLTSFFLTAPFDGYESFYNRINEILIRGSKEELLQMYQRIHSKAKSPILIKGSLPRLKEIDNNVPMWKLISKIISKKTNFEYGARPIFWYAFASHIFSPYLQLPKKFLIEINFVSGEAILTFWETDLLPRLYLFFQKDGWVWRMLPRALAVKKGYLSILGKGEFFTIEDEEQLRDWLKRAR